MELPFPEAGKSIANVECPRLYYSIYHWKSLVNGYSGYFPFFYIRLKDEWLRLPMALNIARLKEIGVRYMVIHSELYNPGISRGSEASSPSSQTMSSTWPG